MKEQYAALVGLDWADQKHDLRWRETDTGQVHTKVLEQSPESVHHWIGEFNSTCRIEWASSLDGPWHSTWPTLTNLLVTSSVMQVEVPMFYRLVCVPPPPAIADITAAEALTLLEERAGEEGFGILDVRTPTEYAAGHVIGALNLDRWSPTFAADLDALPKDHTWLVYCASGNRSAQAVAIMRDQEFRNVHNLLGGFGTFQAFAGAAVWIEP